MNRITLGLNSLREGTLKQEQQTRNNRTGDEVASGAASGAASEAASEQKSARNLGQHVTLSYL